MHRFKRLNLGRIIVAHCLIIYIYISKELYTDTHTHIYIYFIVYSLLFKHILALYMYHSVAILAQPQVAQEIAVFCTVRKIRQALGQVVVMAAGKIYMKPLDQSRGQNAQLWVVIGCFEQGHQQYPAIMLALHLARSCWWLDCCHWFRNRLVAKIIFYSHLPAMEGKKPHWKLADVMRRDMKEHQDNESTMQISILPWVVRNRCLPDRMTSEKAGQIAKSEFMSQLAAVVKLGGGFKYVLCSSLLGEDSHFD